MFCSLRDARADHGVAVQMDSPGMFYIMYIQSQRKAIRLPHLNKLTELVGAIYYHRLSTQLSSCVRSVDLSTAQGLNAIHRIMMYTGPGMSVGGPMNARMFPPPPQTIGHMYNWGMPSTTAFGYGPVFVSVFVLHFVLLYRVSASGFLPSSHLDLWQQINSNILG